MILGLPCMLSGLLGDPGAIRMRGDTGQIYAPCAQFDEKKDIQGLQPEGPPDDNYKILLANVMLTTPQIGNETDRLGESGVSYIH